VIEPNHFLGHASHKTKVVRDEDKRAPVPPELIQPVHAFPLEVRVTNRENFIDEQNIRIYAPDDPEAKAGHHPG
jgi:hypothetical protein